MNTIKKLAFSILTLTALNVSAQTNKVTTAKIIEEKNYVFVATTAIPANSADLDRVMSSMSPGAGGGAVSLSGGYYDLVVKADSIVAYLPYYGRSYRATLNNDENGHKFTAKKFTYTTTKRKKGGWDITMITRDVTDNVQMNLSVSETGYATLSISSNYKQPISYNGYLMEEKKKTL